MATEDSTSIMDYEASESASEQADEMPKSSLEGVNSLLDMVLKSIRPDIQGAERTVALAEILLEKEENGTCWRLPSTNFKMSLKIAKTLMMKFVQSSSTCIQNAFGRGTCAAMTLMKWRMRSHSQGMR